jgi:hypothetical protein
VGSYFCIRHRVYLLTAQVHEKTNDPATVEMGQLLLMRIDDVVTHGVTFGSGIDTYLRQARPTSNYAAATAVVIDGDAGLAYQGLLAFTGLFGDGPGQIPLGATITSAMLTVNTTSSSGPGAGLYRMTVDWTGQSTWSSLGDGIQVGTETSAAADLVVASVKSGVGNFDVTASLNAWLSGATSSAEANLANKGWAFIANGTDGWGFSSFEGTTKPVLTVTYTLPAGESDAIFATSLAAASLVRSDEDLSKGPGNWNPHEDWQPPGLADHHSWDFFLLD